MAKIDIAAARNALNNFQFGNLFVEVLGWSNPRSKEEKSVEVDGVKYYFTEIAHISDVPVLLIANDQIPEKKIRQKIHTKIRPIAQENLLIFTNGTSTQSIWYWVKKEDGKNVAREHSYFKGQPGDLFLSKISNMVFEIKDFEATGDVSVLEVLNRLKNSLDVEPTTKKFFKEYQEKHLAFIEYIEGIDSERDRKWYASVILNRLMFVYFLQKKGFIDNGEIDYLKKKKDDVKKKFGKDKYYEVFLKKLFFEGFAKPQAERSHEDNELLGNIKYLNGGLFLPHVIEENYKDIKIKDVAFDNLLDLFGRYSWNLNDTPGGKDDEINPDVLGYIFEKYINNKSFGAYYTPVQITEYLTEKTIHKLILDKVNESGLVSKKYESLSDLLLDLDAKLCRYLYNDVLPTLSILDPACGSGAFLVAALHSLINIYSAVTGKIPFLKDANLNEDLRKLMKEHSSVGYHIKKLIITNNLFGVDIMQEATEIAKLRLFLALVSSAENVDQLEPLPNIDFNILHGNSLIGFTHITEEKFDAINKESGLFADESYKVLVAEKDRLISLYRKTDLFGEYLHNLRDAIDAHRKKANGILNNLLAEEFDLLKIKFEEATWDEKAQEIGKPKKRPVALADIEALTPFHWGYEFHKVFERGGFDAIITNPPWDIFKPNSKEFFSDYSELVSINKMTIKEFEKEQEELLKKPAIRKAWMKYLNRFPHVSLYFRKVDQFKNQISVVNGKKAGSDINMYKLFTEQCFNLLRTSGNCGIVIPSGIYTDLGTKQLRQMFFEQTSITGLFGFENRKQIFDNVDSRFKFVVLTFEKGKSTKSFPTAFMRHDVNELENFPKYGAITMTIDFIKKQSPDSLSIIEIKNEEDMEITLKMSPFPVFGLSLNGDWKIGLLNEFHMTNDSHLYQTKQLKNMLPLIEGKMFWQFQYPYDDPKYWLNEKEARKSLFGTAKDTGQKLDYEHYRLAFRDIAASTNERCMIMTLLPKNVFCPHTVSLEKIYDIKTNTTTDIGNENRLVALSFCNSFVFDYQIRKRVTNHLSFYIVNDVPLPRLKKEDSFYKPIVEKAAKLVCTSKDYAELWQDVMKTKWTPKCGATDEAERRQLRAELDGIIANVYGLTEEEFSYILSTFPIVNDVVKEMTLAEFRKIAAEQPSPQPSPGVPGEGVLNLIAGGESHELEFKETARWDVRQGTVSPIMGQIVVKTVAGFMNSDGGSLLIGVDDTGNILGLDRDLATFGKKHDPKDEFLQYLQTLILNGCGKESTALIKINYNQVGDAEICKIDIKPSKKQVYVTENGSEKFYVRSGNSTQSLSMREAHEYIEHRFR